jgi:hypothetical protein
MKMLYSRYAGWIARCPCCYAIIGYGPDDVPKTQIINCPQCATPIWVPFDPTYNGIIKEEEKDKNETVV